ncbi:MAG: hypothetical protein E7279_01350 [Lachnospiraceae bacterium]|nr:hypothetical protein [Lachnospiraceae bacterium]
MRKRNKEENLSAKPVQISLFDYLAEQKNNDREVNVVGAVNPKESMNEIDVKLSYGDLILIVSMLRDYVRGLDNIKQDDIQWQVYYRKKFLTIADEISEKLRYDYDETLEKCLKKRGKNDTGEEALILALKV